MKKTLTFIAFISLVVLLVGTIAGMEKRWQEVNTPWLGKVSRIKKMEFIQPDLGWAIGENADEGTGFIIKYEKGHWKLETSLRTRWQSLFLNSLDVVSKNSAWAVGSEYTIWKDRSRGVLVKMQNGRWRRASFPNMSGDYVLNDVAFASENTGWVIGEDRRNLCGRIYRYDGGKWREEHVSGVEGQRFDLTSIDISAKNGSEAWAMGGITLPMEEDNPLIALHYSNGTWKNIELPKPKGSEQKNVRQIDFPSSNEGWAVGKGVFIHYSNGKWMLLDPPGTSEIWSINSVNFTSSSEGWAVGWDQGLSKAIILHYKDGKWSNVSAKWSSKATEVNSVFSSGNHATWVGGSIRQGRGSPAALFRL